MMTNQDSTLLELLNLYWLRPETALWRCIDIQAMSDFKFISPSMEIGCGTGLFSFVRAGGKLGRRFDAFQSVAKLERYFENIDVYDNFDISEKPEIIKKPDYSIDYGIDHKQNLLSQAELLGFYNNLVNADANRELPFENNTFNSIFSNIIYWLEEPEYSFNEIFRVLRPGGRVCLMLPNHTFPEFSFYKLSAHVNNDAEFSFLEKIDRGRFSECLRYSKTADEWCNMACSSGLSLVSHNRHLSKTIIQIWDIGLRPLFPVLKRMVDNLPESEVTGIKNQWIDILKDFMIPLSNLDKKLNQKEEPAFHCFIFEKVNT